MQTFQWLAEYDWVRQAFVGAAAVAVVCSLLSVLVVLKRMAFIGQGISHAGFGGYGLALLLGAAGLGQQSIVLAFCLAAALGIGYLVRSRRVETDTAIGILLVAGMAFGVLMINLWQHLQHSPWYRQTFGAAGFTISWESLLFGSTWTVGSDGMVIALIMAAVVIAVGALLFKELLMFAFDETNSAAFGVPTGWMYYLSIMLLALVVVVSMRLVGFVLVSAMLVLPGATALQMSRRLSAVLALSVAVGLIGTLGGLVLNIELPTLSPGACIVMLLCVMFALVSVGQRVLGGR